MRATLRNDGAAEVVLPSEPFAFHWTVAHARPGAVPVSRAADPGPGTPVPRTVPPRGEVSADFPLSAFCDRATGCPHGVYQVAATDSHGRTAELGFELRPDVAPAPPGAVALRVDEAAFDDAGRLVFEAAFENRSEAPVWVPGADALVVEVAVTWSGGVAGWAGERGADRALDEADGDVAAPGATVVRTVTSDPLELPRKARKGAIHVRISPAGSYYPAFAPAAGTWLAEPLEAGRP